MNQIDLSTINFRNSRRFTFEDELPDPFEGYDPTVDGQADDDPHDSAATAAPVDDLAMQFMYGHERVTTGTFVLRVVVGNTHKQIVSAAAAAGVTLSGVSHLNDIEHVVGFAQRYQICRVVALYDSNQTITPLICDSIARAAERLGVEVTGARISLIELSKATTAAGIEKLINSAEQTAYPISSAGDGWKRNGRQQILANDQVNIRLACDRLGVQLRYNELTDTDEVIGLPGYGPQFEGKARVELRLKIDAEFKFEPSAAQLSDVTSNYAMKNRYHPIRDYLGGLTWDEIRRLDKWLVDYMGAEDTPYTRAVGPITLIAAVRRVRLPGVKFDEMPILEGDQGTGKSSALACLAVRPEWFTDDVPIGDPDPKHIVEALRGKWIAEIGELAAMTKAEVAHLKANLSATHDRARLAYREDAQDFPRQCVFFGSVNPSEPYLRDPTGNRRYWPVKTGKIDLDALQRDRDQLWAEAAVREANGESIRLDSALWSAANEQQQGRQAIDPYVEVLRESLDGFEGWMAKEVAWTILGVAPKDRTPALDSRVASALRILGWERKQARRVPGKSRPWLYYRGNSATTVTAQVNSVTKEVTIFSN